MKEKVWDISIARHEWNFSGVDISNSKALPSATFAPTVESVTKYITQNLPEFPINTRDGSVYDQIHETLADGYFSIVIGPRVDFELCSVSFWAR